MLVKICGNTRLEDAVMAQALGAYMIGIVGVRESPRFVERTEALRIARYVKRPVYVVDGEVKDIAELSKGFWTIQVHRVMSTSELRELHDHSIRVIAYVPMNEEGRQYIFAVRKHGHVPLIHAGPEGLKLEMLKEFGNISDSGVAGGIGMNNVSLLVGSGAMFMDISRGSESSPGVKDPQRIRYLVGVASIA